MSYIILSEDSEKSFLTTKTLQFRSDDTSDKKLAAVGGKPKSIIHPFRQYFTIE